MYLTVREIRVWSYEDFASNGVVTNASLSSLTRIIGPIDDYCISSPSTSCKEKGDYEKETGALYLNLGSVKTLSGIWALFGNLA